MYSYSKIQKHYENKLINIRSSLSYRTAHPNKGEFFIYLKKQQYTRKGRLNMCNNINEVKEYVNYQTGEILDLERVSELKDNAVLKVNSELWTIWNFKKNDELGFNIWKVTKGNTKNAWWYCSKCNDSYPQSIASKLRGSKCAICTGKYVTSVNSLASINPELASQWHPTKNRKTPHDVTYGSNQIVWWLGKCGHEWESAVWSRSNGNGCLYCAGQKVLIGFNDMWTTNPELASLLANPEDGYRYMQTSGMKVDWKCSCCEGIIKKKRIADINKNRLYCQKCDKGKSYPEMFLFNMLGELSVSFIEEKIFEWSNRKRYDFYIPSHNMIIEVHGEQHYTEKFNTNVRSSLAVQIENDIYKREMAIQNGITNYIVIDARKSDLKYLRNNAIKELVKFFPNIESLDYKSIHNNSINSRYKTICDLWNKGLSKEDISTETNISIPVINRYLRRSSKDGITNYVLGSKFTTRKIVKLTIDNILIDEYDSIKDASAKNNGISEHSISKCCNDKSKTAGGFGWMYLKDYKNYIEKQNSGVEKSAPFSMQ